jgi:hypothetical protein
VIATGAGRPASRTAEEVTMKRILAIGVLAAFALLAAGCSVAPAPVPVVGAPADIGRLAGEWGGEYRGETTGRSGNIVFKLSAGADTAFGDVVMIPRVRRPERLPTQDPSAGLPIARVPEVLSIAFVRTAEGGVTGRLVPYRDPECQCMVDTRFEGRVHGETIEGTFTSRLMENREIRTGVWKVTRKQP